MPKLRQTAIQEKQEILPRMIRAKIALLGMKNIAELAMRIGVGQTTLYNYLQDPSKFRYVELLRLFEVLKFTDEEKRKVI